MSGKCINDGNWGLTKKSTLKALRDFRKMAQQRGRCGWAPPGGVEHEVVAEILTHGGTFVVHTSAWSGGDCASRLDVILYQQGIYERNLQNRLLKLNQPGWQKSPWKALTNNVKSDQKSFFPWEIGKGQESNTVGRSSVCSPIRSLLGNSLGGWLVSQCGESVVSIRKTSAMMRILPGENQLF